MLMELDNHQTEMAHQVIMVRWIHPRLDWVKPNTDGSCRGQKTACDGVLRNRFRSWLLGFSSNTDIGSPLSAELWGVLYGLSLVWKCGFRNVWPELDSTTALQLIQDSCDISHPYAELVNGIHTLLIRNWTVFCSHPYKERNRVTDQLAKFGHTINEFSNTQIFDRPLEMCNNLVFQDMIGVFVPRYVRV